MTHWDAEIQKIETHSKHLVTHKPDAMIGIAVDDERKRDYFVPRLQKILDANAWAKGLTFRIVPMVGSPIDLKVTTLQ